MKRQLAQIAGTPRPEEPSDRFLGSLLDLDPASVDVSAAWAETDRIEDRGRTRRRAGIALVGAGSVSAAVLGLTTLGATPLGIGGTTGAPASSIGGASTSSPPTPAYVRPGRVGARPAPGLAARRRGQRRRARPLGRRPPLSTIRHPTRRAGGWAVGENG